MGTYFLLSCASEEHNSLALVMKMHLADLIGNWGSYCVLKFRTFDPFCYTKIWLLITLEYGVSSGNLVVRD